jgi:hypothetical protein
MKKPKRPKGSGSTAALTRPVHIKFSEQQYAAIKAQADADSRPVVQWIRWALERQVKHAIAGAYIDRLMTRPGGKESEKAVEGNKG